MALRRMGSTHFEIDPHRMADSLPKFLCTVTIQTTTQTTNRVLGRRTLRAFTMKKRQLTSFRDRFRTSAALFFFRETACKTVTANHKRPSFKMDFQCRVNFTCVKKTGRRSRVKVKLERGQFYVYAHLPYIISFFVFTRINKGEEKTGLTFHTTN